METQTASQVDRNSRRRLKSRRKILGDGENRINRILSVESNFVSPSVSTKDRSPIPDKEPTISKLPIVKELLRGIENPDNDEALGSNEPNEKLEFLQNMLSDKASPASALFSEEISTAFKEILKHWPQFIPIIAAIISLLAYFTYHLIHNGNNEIHKANLALTLLEREELVLFQIPYVGSIMPFHIFFLIEIFLQYRIYIQSKELNDNQEQLSNLMINSLNNYRLIKYFTVALTNLLDHIAFLLFGLGFSIMIYAILSHLLSIV